MVIELISNDRIIGGMTHIASLMAMDVYKTFVEGKLVVTDARTAEMCKLTENSFRDVNIAFANELSIICDKLHINVWELIAVANRHPRVNILQPSVGVGGHCIAVDPWFIINSTPEQAALIRMARDVNNRKPEWVLEKVKAAVTDALAQKQGSTIANVKVACLGLAYKPDIEDLRESPAIEVTEHIAALGCEVLAVEPNVEELPPAIKRPNLKLTSLDNALATADIVCVLVKHKSFVQAADNIRGHKRVIDPVGLLDSR
jgi:UDP-N-acetyl-D-mannosaminuronic acid dehydrogenase